MRSICIHTQEVHLLYGEYVAFSTTGRRYALNAARPMQRIAGTGRRGRVVDSKDTLGDTGVVSRWWKYPWPSLAMRERLPQRATSRRDAAAAPYVRDANACRSVHKARVSQCT
jgi:hypothetical protein